MIGILSQTTNPAFNLATEEYLLKDMKEDVFFLYVNEPSIIVGKHQNTLAEIDYNYISKNEIPVYRRLSGGGTVYHDLGNLNFCFITNEKKGNLVNFDKHSQPIVKALKALGLTVITGKRHDLTISGKKITGTASHVFKNRSIHHGTLLFNTVLTVLNRCLNTTQVKYSDRAVKSIGSEVTNISEYLEQTMTMKEFKLYLFNYLLSYFNDAKKYELTTRAEEIVNGLIETKYSTWEWNYGYSPVYEFTRTIKTENGVIISKIRVEKGIIKEALLIVTEADYKPFLDMLSNSITGVQHSRRAVLSAFNELSPTVPGLTQENLFKLFF
ncbi:MAG: lipoate--protein ligase [Flavobacteriales bacterium]|nr:lipoate--protein ligase [Flavobacteriales bacterium]